MWLKLCSTDRICSCIVINIGQGVRWPGSIMANPELVLAHVFDREVHLRVRDFCEWSRMSIEDLAGHSVRVGEMGVEVLEELRGEKYPGLGVEKEILRSAADFHDVGKLGLPEKLVNKPGRFEAGEYEEVKTHVMRGFGLVHDAPRMLKDALISHHMDWNGGGYPRVDLKGEAAVKSLEGEQIPLLGRIIHVTDVYDALTDPAREIYRETLSPQQAWEYLVRMSGIMFDPEVVIAFGKTVLSKEIEKQMCKKTEKTDYYK